MAKFCNNCGAQVDDAAQFCGNCGNQFAAPQPAPQPQYQQPVYAAPEVPAEAPAPVKKSPKKLIILLGIIGAALILTIILIRLIFPSPKSVIKKGIKGINNANPNAIVKVIPPFMFEDAEDKEDAIENIEDYLEEFEEEYDGEKIKYEIKEIEKLSASERKSMKATFELIESFGSYDDFDADRVSDMRKAEVELEIDGDDADVELILIKYGGKWYIWNYSDILYFLY